MKPLVLRLRAAPEQRLDLSPLAPHRLAGKSAREIAAIELQTTRRRVQVGDVFALSTGNVENIVIDGGSERFDGVGEGMNAGSITVKGDVGNQAGRRMAGGRLTIQGRSGHWTASGMTAGVIEIAGDAGDRLGGPLAGETQGMSGGMVVIRGDVGARAGDRLRRGTLIVEGGAEMGAGSRMLAGTLIVCGGAGPRAGYLMRRGTLVLGATDDDPGSTFLDCGVHDLVALRLMAAFVSGASRDAAALLRGSLRRYAGDTAVLGKGEIFVAA
jgi:formylmethanofuran dehydrogenase subunit C